MRRASSRAPGVLLVVTLALGGCADIVRPRLSPSVETMPRGVEEDAGAVSAYLRAREPDPLARLRAVYDFVVTRIAYDYDAREVSATANDVTATQTFEARRGSSAGLAALVARLAVRAGVPVKVIGGTSGAWNVACLDGRPLYIDASRAASHYFWGGQRRVRRRPEDSFTFDRGAFAAGHPRTLDLGPWPASAASTSCRLARAVGADAQWSSDCAPRLEGPDC